MDPSATSPAAKTVTRHLKPGPELEKVEREVANYQLFRDMVNQAIAINEQICDARGGDEKKGSTGSSWRSSRPPSRRKPRSS